MSWCFTTYSGTFDTINVDCRIILQNHYGITFASSDPDLILIFFCVKKTFQNSVSSMQRKKNEHFKLNCYAIFPLSSLCMYKTYITYVRHLIWNHALENLHCKFANIQRLNLSAINLIYCSYMIYVLRRETFNNEMVDAITHCS